MCNLLEIVQGTKLNGLDAVLGHSAMSSAHLAALHRDMGPALVQRQKKDLVAQIAFAQPQHEFVRFAAVDDNTNTVTVWTLPFENAGQ